MQLTFRIVLLASMLLSIPARAQTSLSAQINAVSAVQDREQAHQDAVARAAADQALHAQAQQRAPQAHLQHRHGVVAKLQQEEARAERQREEVYQDQLREILLERARLQLTQEQQRITTDKQRDQTYEDKLRDLALQQKALELKQLETRVARETDVIDHDLKTRDAITDVIRPNADATSSISEGVRVSLEHPQPGAKNSEPDKQEALPAGKADVHQ